MYFLEYSPNATTPVTREFTNTNSMTLEMYEKSSINPKKNITPRIMNIEYWSRN
ncbi:MAG: hypothetical protein C5S43_00385 [Candidatus Methanocomedens sp.]|nr:MAG: hypothetical protein C5S43_00385 [ANME-2 cluster archaeon]